MPSGRLHVQGLRSLQNQKEDPNYLRFQLEYFKTTGKTNLLTPTTKEQMASVLPDGTILPTGKQIRDYYRNDGSVPAYLNVPLSTLPIENRLKTEPTKNSTTMIRKLQEKELNRPKPTKINIYKRS